MTEEQEKFIEDNHKTMSVLQLAEKLGFKRSTVYNYCYNKGLSPHRQRNKSFGRTNADWEKKDGTFCVESYAHNII
jgi:hypothetical protein